MLFMVIERFRNADAGPIGSRFAQRGRMMPPDVTYHASWIDPARSRCFQVMEAPTAEALKPWTDAWSDLVEFEVVPVLTSKEFWIHHNARSPRA